MLSSSLTRTLTRTNVLLHPPSQVTPLHSSHPSSSFRTYPHTLTHTHTLQVITIGATNLAQDLDQALLRPGRFEVVY